MLPFYFETFEYLRSLALSDTLNVFEFLNPDMLTDDEVDEPLSYPSDAEMDEPDLSGQCMLQAPTPESYAKYYRRNRDAPAPPYPFSISLCIARRRPRCDRSTPVGALCTCCVFRA